MCLNIFFRLTNLQVSEDKAWKRVQNATRTVDVNSGIHERPANSGHSCWKWSSHVFLQ